MEVISIEAFNLDDAWYKCVRTVMTKGHDYKVAKGGSHEGEQRREFPFVIVRIEKPYAGCLAPKMPPGANYPPPTDDETIRKYYVDYLVDPSSPEEKGVDEDYTYGHQLTGIVDQISAAVKKHVNAIYDEGGTNQAVMEIGQPSHIELKSPPCLRLIDTKIYEGKLWLIVYFRSWDLIGGFPANLGAIQLLKKDMVDMINLQIDELNEQPCKHIMNLGEERSPAFCLASEQFGEEPSATVIFSTITLNSNGLCAEQIHGRCNWDKKTKIEHIEDGGLICLSKGLHIYEHSWDYAKARLNKLEVNKGEEK